MHLTSIQMNAKIIFKNSFECKSEVNMKENLEDLWFYYLIEVPIKKTDKEKEIIKNWSEKENCFKAKLTREQIEMFEEYDNSLSQVNRITEKNAFMKGIMFATRFIFEAMCDE